MDHDWIDRDDLNNDGIGPYKVLNIKYLAANASKIFFCKNCSLIKVHYDYDEGCEFGYYPLIFFESNLYLNYDKNIYKGISCSEYLITQILL